MKNARLALPALLISALFLSACATTGPGESAGHRDAVDYRYVNAVNREARRAGIEVHWVNPPRERDRRKKRQQQP